MHAMHEGLDAMTENLLLLPSVNVCTACQGDCQSGRPIATNTNTVPRRMLSYSTNSYSNRTVRALEAERRRSSAPLKPYLLETRQPANPPTRHHGVGCREQRNPNMRSLPSASLGTTDDHHSVAVRRDTRVFGSGCTGCVIRLRRAFQIPERDGLGLRSKEGEGNWKREISVSGRNYKV
jgi:hypothetical protein